MIRYAITTSPQDQKIVMRYLPENYRCVPLYDGRVLLFGEDLAGWTMQDYVLPRLGSGLIVAREIDDQDVLRALAESAGVKTDV